MSNLSKLPVWILTNNLSIKPNRILFAGTNEPLIIEKNTSVYISLRNSIYQFEPYKQVIQSKYKIKIFFIYFLTCFI